MVPWALLNDDKQGWERLIDKFIRERIAIVFVATTAMMMRMMMSTMMIMLVVFPGRADSFFDTEEGSNAR